jgi:hypothetical protein
MTSYFRGDVVFGQVISLYFYLKIKNINDSGLIMLFNEVSMA